MPDTNFAPERSVDTSPVDKDACYCSPGDGTKDCPQEQRCFERWLNQQEKKYSNGPKED